MMQYFILLTLEFKHAYYDMDQVCRDFDLFFPEDTIQLLKNRKLMAKVSGGKVYLLFEADSSRAPLATASGTTLRMGLILHNPFFSYFTKLDFVPDATMPFYQNTVQPQTFDAVKGVVGVGPLFSHLLAKTNRPVTAVLKNAKNHTVQTNTVTSADNRSILSYDLTGQAPGVYTLEEAYPSQTQSTLYYMDPELLQRGVFGVIEMKIDPTFYTAPPEFKISFEAKKQTLKYYIIGKNYTESEFNQIVVSDNGFNESGRPQIRFTKVTASKFKKQDIPRALLAEENDQVVLFKSQSPVTRQVPGRKKIQLKKQGEVLIADLPQPGENRPTADLVLQVSKPS